MRCPACKEVNKDRVIDSRLTDSGAAVRRRRVCMVCGRRFTTKERSEAEMRLSVVKRDGRRVPYRRDNIVRGVRLACYKLPIEEEAIDRLVDRLDKDDAFKGDGDGKSKKDLVDEVKGDGAPL